MCVCNQTIILVPKMKTLPSLEVAPKPSRAHTEADSVHAYCAPTWTVGSAMDWRTCRRLQSVNELSESTPRAAPHLHCASCELIHIHG